MQAILSQLPEIGKIYAIQGDPDARIKVTEVHANIRMSETKRECDIYILGRGMSDSDAEAVILWDEWCKLGFAVVSEELRSRPGVADS